MDSENEVYQKFRGIHAEVIGNIKELKANQDRANQLSSQIPEKKRSVFSLREEVEELKSQNEEYNEILIQKKLEKDQYDDQAAQLLELISIFEEKISSYNDTECPDLPIDVKSKVDMKINEVIQTVSSEYTRARADLYEKERKEIHDKNKEIEAELQLLQKLDNDWTQCDNFDLVIEESKERYTSEPDLEFQSLASINIPIVKNPPSKLETVYRASQLPQPDIESLIQEINKFEQLIQSQNNFVKSVYTSQAKFLSILRDSLKNRPLTELDLKNLEEQLQIQIQKMSEFTEIYPLQIPDDYVDGNKNDDDNAELISNPIRILADKFHAFCEEMNLNRTYDSLCDNLIESANQSLNIPPFEEPKKPSYILNPRPNEELVLLAENIKSLIDTAKQQEQLHNLLDLTSKQKEFLSELKSNRPSEIPREQFPLPKEIPVPQDDEMLSIFKEMVSLKLPDQFSDFINKEKIGSFITTDPISAFSNPNDSTSISSADSSINPNANNDNNSHTIENSQENSQRNDISETPENNGTTPENNNNNSNTNNINYIDDGENVNLNNTLYNNSDEISNCLELNVFDRMKQLNDIMKEYVSIELPPPPHFTPPVPAEVKVDPIDTTPLMETIDIIMSPANQDVSSLTDEVIALEKTISELNRKLKNESDEEQKNENILQNIQEYILEKERENAEIADKKKQMKEMYNPIFEKASQLANEVEQIQKDLEENFVSDEMISEKENELNKKRDELEQIFLQKLKGE
ncbi:hypothetical protein TRFO_27702 [Tritrichomonas foetus]|uniref:Uncharacterized protein n=1 Tax=Tritrichomonas foetus TaxID=1144522 RepID=A0A1J4K5F3_9EUKA|nr:hypothetical protein TRFO_27702 [Tritrichomonas foetus]|eukprot:OHT04701.1 hypothetical protein TRFO_27702 [Tritrichomonas foetus]